MTLPKFIEREEAARLVSSLAAEFAVVRNPRYIYSPYELYPLAPKQAGPLERLSAAVMDMDGTTTTTETLCLHSLETMVRRITGRPEKRDWPGLDPVRDYPNVIGNSTTRHVEYLVHTYQPHISKPAFARALVEAAAWTLAEGKDAARREELKATLRHLGWPRLVEDAELKRLLAASPLVPSQHAAALDALAARYLPALQIGDFGSTVRGAIDIYYYRYHEILAGIARGEGAELSRALVAGRPLIEPMPGVGVFLALTKGWLGEAAGDLYGVLVAEANSPPDLPPAEEGRWRLAALGQRFQQAPLRLAMVTSSIRYEADIVLDAVFGVLRRRVGDWPVKSELAERFGRPVEFYDAFITASDSSEIRLKPHRDLYSIALHVMGIAPDEFSTVVGFEDSESGTIAIRAAGVGLCVAVPFTESAGHDFAAASLVLRGGLPEALLKYNLFLKP